MTAEVPFASAIVAAAGTSAAVNVYLAGNIVCTALLGPPAQVNLAGNIVCTALLGPPAQVNLAGNIACVTFAPPPPGEYIGIYVDTEINTTPPYNVTPVFGFNTFVLPVAQRGNFIGYHIITDVADASLVSMTGIMQVYTPRI